MRNASAGWLMESDVLTDTAFINLTNRSAPIQRLHGKPFHRSRHHSSNQQRRYFASEYLVNCL